MLRIIKKSIAWSLAVVMLFTVSPVFADNEAKSGKSEINDISRSWAKSMIEKLSENEIITGYPDGTFRPDKEVSREEACVMIAKYISGNNVGNSSSEFKDTKGRWSDPYIAFMLKEKLVSGYPDGMFKPAKPISREEFSFILYNYLKKVVDMGKVETVQFKDSVSSWAKDAVGKLAGLKIISGYQDGLFRGANNIVRAEIAKLITETDKKQETPKLKDSASDKNDNKDKGNKKPEPANPGNTSGGGGSGGSVGPIISNNDADYVKKAEGAANKAVYKDMAQAEAASEEAVLEAVKKTAEKAVNNSAVTVKVNKVEYVAAVAGDSGNTQGTDGSFKFTIEVKKGKEKAVTEEKSIKITATKFLRINQYSSKIVEQESAGVKKLDIKLKWEMLKKPAIEKYSIEYGDVKIEFIPKSINIVEDFITNYIEYDSLRDSNKELSGFMPGDKVDITVSGKSSDGIVLAKASIKLDLPIPDVEFEKAGCNYDAQEAGGTLKPAFNIKWKNVQGAVKYEISTQYGTPKEFTPKPENITDAGAAITVNTWNDLNMLLDPPEKFSKTVYWVVTAKNAEDKIIASGKSGISKPAKPDIRGVDVNNERWTNGKEVKGGLSFAVKLTTDKDADPATINKDNFKISDQDGTDMNASVEWIKSVHDNYIKVELAENKVTAGKKYKLVIKPGFKHLPTKMSYFDEDKEYEVTVKAENQEKPQDKFLSIEKCDWDDVSNRWYVDMIFSYDNAETLAGFITAVSADAENAVKIAKSDNLDSHEGSVYYTSVYTSGKNFGKAYVRVIAPKNKEIFEYGKIILNLNGTNFEKTVPDRGLLPAYFTKKGRSENGEDNNERIRFWFSIYNDVEKLKGYIEEVTVDGRKYKLRSKASKGSYAVGQNSKKYAYIEIASDEDNLFEDQGDKHLIIKFKGGKQIEHDLF